MTRNMRESLAEDDPDLLFADGFDDAILGVVRRVGQEAFVLYDTEEYFGFNVEGAWVGERAPGFVSLPEADDEDESDDE